MSVTVIFASKLRSGFEMPDKMRYLRIGTKVMPIGRFDWE
jgi:hypothetical protein